MKLSTIILAVITCAFSSCNFSKEKEVHLFILMGQSNMAGYGRVLPQDTIPIEGVYYIPTLTDEPSQWKPAKHPLHNRLSSDNFGLGLPFAKKYKSENKNVDILLIPVAWGGATIDQLNKGSEIYNDAIQRVLSLLEKNPNIKLKGVLWHQGESDTVSEELAALYEGKLHKLIADLRADFQNENLPFVAGNLAEFYGTGVDHCAPERVKQIDMVKQTLRDIPIKVKNCGFVESTGCKSPDQHQVHFDRESYIILGERYADEMNRLCKESLKNI